MMDESLLQALNNMTDEFGLVGIEEILENPDQYVYQPELDD